MVNKISAFVILLFGIHIVSYSQQFEGDLILKEHFGCCSHITRSHGGTLDYPIRDQELSIFSESKINWCRSDLDSYTVMPDKTGNWRFETFDSVLISLKKYDVGFLPILDRSYNGKFAWEGDWYEKYITKVGERYNNVFFYWEVMNEMDLVQSNKSDVYSGYLKSLEKTYNTLKQINNKNQILSTSFGNVDFKMLDYLCDNEGYKYWDIFNLHCYASPEELPKVFSKVKNRMDKYKWTAPVWLTECGMSSADVKGEATNVGFFKELLPVATQKIGINLETTSIAVIRDGKCGYSAMTSSEMDRCLKDVCKNVISVSLDMIKDLSIQSTPILIVSGSECFPMQYFDTVVDYVKKGGTIVLYQGVPFYYDLKKINGTISKVNSSGNKLSKLHMSSLLWWTQDAKKKDVPEVPTVINPFCNYKWEFSKNASARYMTTTHLEEGDTLISLIDAGNEKYIGSVAGIYKLNSTLKGNIIFQTRLGANVNLRGEKEQARRIPRISLISFAYGINKVFLYNFRSREDDLYDIESHFGLVHKDLSPKLSLKAYQTIINFLPESSSRPKLEINDHLYIASWMLPNDDYIYAVWNPYGLQSVELNGFRKGRIYNYLGEKVKKNKEIVVSDEVVYVVTNKPISIE